MSVLLASILIEVIHPFIDGNGRTGCLIMNIDLIRNSFPSINVKFTDRKRYYDVFDAYYKEDDAVRKEEFIDTVTTLSDDKVLKSFYIFNHKYELIVMNKSEEKYIL